jgi:hypothetical protein
MLIILIRKLIFRDKPRKVNPGHYNYALLRGGIILRYTHVSNHNTGGKYSKDQSLFKDIYLYRYTGDPEPIKIDILSIDSDTVINTWTVKHVTSKL